ncbi:TPA: hypothetical protein ACF3I9_004405 [Klebsiella aerogenes]
MCKIPPKGLVQALSPYWHRQPKTNIDLNDVVKERAFLDLKAYCVANYEKMDGGMFSSHPLATVLCLLGVPFVGKGQSAPNSLLDVATKLDEALTRTQTTRVHLCPLDCADHIEPFQFGNAEIRRFSASELEQLLNVSQYQRLSYYKPSDLEALSRFTWLIVWEQAELALSVSHRNHDFLVKGLQRDYGEIAPYYQRYPKVFNTALFGLLLAPWEEWVTHVEVDWKAFHVKWVHTVESDLLTSPKFIPDADTLSWDYKYYEDDGKEHEVYAPYEYPSYCSKSELETIVNNQLMININTARVKGLINEAARHHFLKAFLSDGIDEFLAHIVVIDACLGEPRELKGKFNFTKQQNKMGFTKRLECRLAGLLGDAGLIDELDTLYDLRSTYVHGLNMHTISGSQKNRARVLARKTLLEITRIVETNPGITKRDFLVEMLDRGMSLVE